MRTLAQALAVFLPALYLTTAFLYGLHFTSPGAPRVLAPRRATLLAVLVLHPLWFLVQGRRSDVFPAWEAWTTLSMVTMAIVWLFVLTSRRVAHGGVGAVVLGTAALLQLGASAFGPLDPPTLTARSGSFYLFHALTSVAAAAALVLSGLYGGLYLTVFRRMRNHRIDAFLLGLPSLRTLASLTRRAALAGFLLLAVGLNVGIGYAHVKHVAGFHYSDPWVLALILLWVHFGVVAFSHRIPGFSARRASFAAAAGLTVLLAAGLLTLIPDMSFHWRAGQ